jgi:hypothetical protein
MNFQSNVKIANETNAEMPLIMLFSISSFLKILWMLLNIIGKDKLEI